MRQGRDDEEKNVRREGTIFQSKVIYTEYSMIAIKSLAAAKSAFGKGG